MSGVHFLDKLLDEVAVKWRTLGEITSIKTGQAVNKQMISANPGEYPVINSGREPLGFIDEWNTENDPIGITSRGAGVGSVTWQPGKYFRGNLNYSVTIKRPRLVSTRFLYHLLLEMQPEIQALCTYDGIPALNAGNLKDLLIPIPCPDNQKKSLEIQAEIVRILDAFTELTAELTAELTTELTARKKQYNFYRDRLLSFEEGEVEWRTLGELVKTVTAPSKLKSQSYCAEGKLPIIDQGIEYIAGYTNEDITPVDADKYVIFGDHSEHIKYVDFSFVQGADGIKILRPISSNAKYIFYAFENFYKKELSYKRHWSTAQETLIPVPPITEQARIVAMLEKFDALTHSLTEGLPREIELRQKQYTYYRDLLLSFPKPEEAGA